MFRFLVHPVARLLTLVFVLALIIVAALDTTGIKARVSSVVFETYIKVQPREASGQLMFVDIDDESLTKVGQWPWPRTYLAEMIGNINRSGASVIIFDGVLAEPDRTSPENIAKLLDEAHPARGILQEMPENDGVLAEAIQSAGNFVAGFSHGSNTKSPIIKRRVLSKKAIKDFFLQQQDHRSLYFETTAQFLPELQKAAAGNGSFMASSENDAVIRRTGLMFHDGEMLYPSLVLEGIRLYENQGKEYIRLDGNENYNNFQISEPLTISIGQYKVPTGADGKMWVHFRRFTPDESVSAYRFLDEFYTQNPPDLSDKIIFIASSAEGLMDLRATPLGMKPGVKVHMNALEQILQGRYLIRPHTADLLEIGAAVGVSLLIIVLSFFVNPVWLLLVTLGVSGSSFWVSWYLFSGHGGLFDPVTPTIMIALIFVAASVLSYLKTEFERRQVRGAFGMYVSPDVMRDLEKHPENLQLGGENKDLTVMFTDIRKFTTISEGLTPEELINLMNEFLTVMSDIVLQHKGTIDKYMGDAMMAFWNAPKDVEGHQREACIAALKMQDALAPINERLKEKAEAQGKEPVLLQAGIGLNTGPCAVGNMGSHQRFAYSALGDAVNLGSRLEGQTKNYGADILISEETYKEASELAALEIDIVTVKGKTKPVRVFMLLGDETVQEAEAFQQLKKEHDVMIEAYRSGAFKNAQKALKACRKQELFDLSVAYDLYEERIKELIKNPPDEGWDGVYEATTK